MSDSTIKAIFVIGPTATGKTRMGVDVARAVDGEIISVDSRQVYKGLDLGTGKDLIDYGSGDDAVPYHLIDIVEPTEEYHVHRFLHDATAAIRDITSRGKIPVFVGGSIFYINALLNRYELPGGEPNLALRKELEEKSTDELLEMLNCHPEILKRTDTASRKRIIRALEVAATPEEERTTPPEIPDFDYILLAPYFHRKVVHGRIHKRLVERIDEGMINEVRTLHEAGVSWEKLDWFGLEYRWVAQYLQGNVSRDEMTEKLFIAIRQFTKRQDIWCRKLEREGQTIHWIIDGDSRKAITLAGDFLANHPLPGPELRLDDIRY